jgi:phosphopantothenoylcysteine decarboxylase/phosphopantothenate--cysteine ligase
MGFALAEAAGSRGAEVTLVSGPTDLPTPHGVRRIDVVTAEEMFRAVLEHADADLVLMSAAVSDYAPAEIAASKIKKGAIDEIITLKKTPDILQQLGAQKKPQQVLVGFALETDDVLTHAADKMKRKNLDWIVANDLREPGAGFGKSTNRVTMLSREGDRLELPLGAKPEVAHRILDQVVPSLRRS